MREFLSEWNNDVYRRGRSRPSMRTAAFGHPVRHRKSFGRSKTKRERSGLHIYSGEMFGLGPIPRTSAFVGSQMGSRSHS